MEMARIICPEYDPLHTNWRAVMVLSNEILQLKYEISIEESVQDRESFNNAYSNLAGDFLKSVCTQLNTSEYASSPACNLPSSAACNLPSSAACNLPSSAACHLPSSAACNLPSSANDINSIVKSCDEISTSGNAAVSSTYEDQLNR